MGPEMAREGGLASGVGRGPQGQCSRFCWSLSESGQPCDVYLVFD